MTPPSEEDNKRVTVQDVRVELRSAVKDMRKVLDRIEAMVKDDKEDPCD